MTHKIADLSLDELISCLIAGEILRTAGGDTFYLPLEDSRAILAFYDKSPIRKFKKDCKAFVA